MIIGSFSIGPSVEHLVFFVQASLNPFIFQFIKSVEISCKTCADKPNDRNNNPEPLPAIESLHALPRSLDVQSLGKQRLLILIIRSSRSNSDCSRSKPARTHRRVELIVSLTELRARAYKRFLSVRDAIDLPGTSAKEKGNAHENTISILAEKIAPPGLACGL